MILLLTAAPLRSQSKWQRFRQLSRPERCWTLGHLWVAGRVARASDRAIAIADSMAPMLDGDPIGGAQDAFKHGIWMALLVQDIPPSKARSLGEAHEKGNYHQFLHRKPEDGVMQDHAASQMDLLNNASGREIGQRMHGKPQALLITEVHDRVCAGQFTIIAKDTLGRSLRQDGTPIPDTQWQGNWENDRHLIPSHCTHR